MKALLLPVIFVLIGGGAGVGAGFALKSEPEDLPDLAADPCGDPPDATTTTAARPAEPAPGTPRDYARLNNQFVIPIVQDGRVTSLVVMSLQIEVEQGRTASVFAAEPRLRDGFLQDMFNHANIGGFSGNFTTGTNMRRLRNDLFQTARRIVGEDVTDVLITDIVRQDS
jgi:flagellar FliL protein